MERLDHMRIVDLSRLPAVVDDLDGVLSYGQINEFLSTLRI